MAEIDQKPGDVLAADIEKLAVPHSGVAGRIRNY